MYKMTTKGGLGGLGVKELLNTILDCVMPKSGYTKKRGTTR